MKASRAPPEAPPLAHYCNVAARRPPMPSHHRVEDRAAPASTAGCRMRRRPQSFFASGLRRGHNPRRAGTGGILPSAAAQPAGFDSPPWPWTGRRGGLAQARHVEVASQFAMGRHAGGPPAPWQACCGKCRRRGGRGRPLRRAAPCQSPTAGKAGLEIFATFGILSLRSAAGLPIGCGRGSYPGHFFLM